MSRMAAPDDFLTGKLPPEEADICSLSFAKFLMADTRRFTIVMDCVKGGGEFAKMFQGGLWPARSSRRGLGPQSAEGPQVGRAGYFGGGPIESRLPGCGSVWLLLHVPQPLPQPGSPRRGRADKPARRQPPPRRRQRASAR